MKKIGFILVLILTLTLLCNCGGYVKNYSATILITSCQGDEASMEFDTFKGTYNFELRRDDDADHTLNLEASLDIFISVLMVKRNYSVSLRVENLAMKRLHLIINMIMKKQSTCA